MALLEPGEFIPATPPDNGCDHDWNHVANFIHPKAELMYCPRCESKYVDNVEIEIETTYRLGRTEGGE